jgi:hypothetical protein
LIKFFYKELEAITFNTLWKLAETAPASGVTHISFFEYVDDIDTVERHPYFKDFVPDVVFANRCSTILSLLSILQNANWYYARTN